MLSLDLGEIRYYFVTRTSKHTDDQGRAHFVSGSEYKYLGFDFFFNIIAQMLRPLFIILSLATFSIVNAQTILTSAGGTLSNENFAATWTLGEVFVDDLSGLNHTLTSGFNQNGLNDIQVSITEGILSLRIYPNPVADRLIIESDNRNEYELISVNGALMSGSHALDSRHVIDVSGFPPGIYLMRITDVSKSRHTFKIIKE